MPKLRLMISSRCNTKIKDNGSSAKLSNIRAEVKKELQELKLFEKNPYEVWISEEPTDINSVESSWDACMSEVEKADILLCIYTGEAGCSKNDGDIGICHAELETAFNKEPSKVYIINACDAVLQSPKELKTDKAFKKYLNNINRFYIKACNKDEIVSALKTATVDATIALAKMGKREARRGKYNFGEALDWSRMNFVERSDSIKDIITSTLTDSGHQSSNEGIIYNQNKKGHLFIIHGVPSGMNVSAAREMVGQPFLRDHKYITSQNDKSNGPIHIIGVHKGVTEQQVIATLGQPDAVVVDGPFGIYVADKVQNIQLVFLSNCRDGSSTKHNVQRFMNWLEESGERDDFFIRSGKRRKLIDLIIKQQKDS